MPLMVFALFHINSISNHGNILQPSGIINDYSLFYGSFFDSSETISVYNITCADHRKVPWGEVIAMSKRIAYDYPMETGLWYPDGTITTNRFHHEFNVILFHWLPAYLIDFILFICGQKRL